MGIIAEGVETDQQAKQLMALDCPHAQGYLFSRPLSVPDAQAFLVKQLTDGREQPVRSPRQQL
jgi:EAL domain-containing protein (putative c-di-GMP-specific phosphodiesterase class I)